MQVVAGTINVSIDIRAMTSAGAALTGKVAADFTIWYRLDGAKVAIALSDLAELTTIHTDGGIKEIGDGWYRLDLPDLATAVGVNRVAIGGSVAGGVVLSAPVTLLPFEADADRATAIDRIATMAAGDVTGAQTAAEVFEYGTVTGTVTADADGNRTIAWS